MSDMVKFEHVAEFDAALDEWVARIHKATAAGIRAAGAEVAKQTAAGFGSGSAPVSRSGALARSVVTTEPKPVGANQWEAKVGPAGLAYVRRVELGKHSPHSAGPHPYFRPGFKRAGGRFAELFRAAWAEASHVKG